MGVMLLLSTACGLSRVEGKSRSPVSPWDYSTAESSLRLVRAETTPPGGWSAVSAWLRCREGAGAAKCRMSDRERLSPGNQHVDRPDESEENQKLDPEMAKVHGRLERVKANGRRCRFAAVHWASSRRGSGSPAGLTHVVVGGGAPPASRRHRHPHGARQPGHARRARRCRCGRPRSRRRPRPLQGPRCRLPQCGWTAWVSYGRRGGTRGPSAQPAHPTPRRDRPGRAGCAG
jgi:hypothetical protein